ncbi:hypothetical protein D5045_24675 [Verminephrobacter eiseniae]|nr:hypothetical protein [Verminephrobacter eiseniae]
MNLRFVDAFHSMASLKSIFWLWGNCFPDPVDVVAPETDDDDGPDLAQFHAARKAFRHHASGGSLE